VKPDDMLEAMCGLRLLDGRAEFVTSAGPDDHSGGDHIRVFVLRLDGAMYWFQEDPQDGYRSSLGIIKRIDVNDLPPGSFISFPPITVECRIQTKPEIGSYREDDYRFYGVNEQTGLVIFEVGTENYHDWYPMFVALWTPDGYHPMWLDGDE